MPGKKKKYNARFPPARIKKIMQSDEEVGKVAAPVPVIISRTLELFVQSLLTRAGEITMARQARTLTPSHLKQCIMAEQRFDFLQEIFSTVPDIGPEADSEMPTPPVTPGEICSFPKTVISQPHSGRGPTDSPSNKKECPTSGRGRGRGRPRKSDSLSAPLPKRPRGRPRKVQPYVCHDEEEIEDDDDSEDGLEIESSDEGSENDLEVFEPAEIKKQPCPQVGKQESRTPSNSFFRPDLETSRKSTSLSSSCVLDGGIHISIPSLPSSLHPLANSATKDSCESSSLTITNNGGKSISPLSAEANGPSVAPPILDKGYNNNTTTITYGTSNGTSGIPVPVITSVEAASKLLKNDEKGCLTKTDDDEDYDC